MQFEKQLQTTLRNLIKLCLTKTAATGGCDKLAATYKQLYSLTLRRPTGKMDVVQLGKHLQHILGVIRAELAAPTQ